MQPAEVLAIELRQYEGQGLKTLVPIVLGQTQDSVQKKGGGASGPKRSRVWDEAAILTEIEGKGGDAALAAAREIIAWMGSRADRVGCNANPAWGWIGAEFDKDGVRIPALRLGSDAAMAVYFEYMLGKPVFDDLRRRQELLDRLNAVPGIKLPPDAVSKRKTIPLAPFTPASTAAFLAAMDWFVEELRNPRPGPDTALSSAGPGASSCDPPSPAWCFSWPSWTPQRPRPAAPIADPSGTGISAARASPKPSAVPASAG